MKSALPLAGVAFALITGAVAAGTVPAQDAAGSSAPVSVRCAQDVGESFGKCRAVAVRSGPSVDIVVTFPSGFSRTLTFSGGDFLRGNATMSGVGTDTEWYRAEDTYHVRVDDQRYEIPANLVVDR